MECIKFSFTDTIHLYKQSLIIKFTLSTYLKTINTLSVIIINI